MFSLTKVGVFLSIIIFFKKNIYAAEGMPQFNIETFPSQLFWLIITFVILYLIINFLILPRIRSNLRLRKNKISNDLERAELIKTQIEKISKEYDEKITKSKNRSNDTIKNAIEKANDEFTSQLNNVKKKISKKIFDAEKETLEYKNSLSNEISDISKEVSLLLIKKILGKSLSKSDIENIYKQKASMDGK